MWEIQHARQVIQAKTGVSIKYFRFPGGCHSAADVRLVRSLGLIPVQRTVITGDPYQHDPQVIINHVLSKVSNGAIIVMHLNGAPNTPETFDALHVLIPALRDRGYTMVRLSDLLSPPV